MQTNQKTSIPTDVNPNSIEITRLSPNVEYRAESRGLPFSAAEYQRDDLATLALLRSAYFERNPDGSWLCPSYRESVLANRGYGEWTSTMLKDGKIVVENPEILLYKNCNWLVEGGRNTLVELPPEGWVLEYDKGTGLPCRTSRAKKDAENLFGEDASYFYGGKRGFFRRTKSGIDPVLRVSDFIDRGPFCIVVTKGLGSRYSHIGARPLLK